jgi:hypothetical protein
MTRGFLSWRVLGTSPFFVVPLVLALSHTSSTLLALLSAEFLVHWWIGDRLFADDVVTCVGAMRFGALIDDGGAGVGG